MAKIDQDQAPSTHRDRIVRALRVHGSLARVDLSRIVALSPPSVSAVTAEMLREGIVREVAGADFARPSARANNAVGRPKVLIDLVPETACVVAAKLSVNEIRLALGDFTGAIVATETHTLDTRSLSARDVIDFLGNAIAEFRDRMTGGFGDCVGIGIAVQGTVREASTISWSPALSMRNLEVARTLSPRFRLPVVLENDANCVAIAIHSRPQYQQVRNLAIVMIGSGVGMGLFIDGKLYLGHTGASAEFGHTKYQVDGPLCMCGMSGCLESYVADYALYRDARTILDLPPTDAQHPSEEQMRMLTRLARGGNSQVAQLFEKAGRVLGYGLGNLIALLSPELVLISGAGVRGYRELEAGIRRGLDEALLANLRADTRIEAYPWDEDLTIRGVIAAVFDETATPASVTISRSAAPARRRTA